MIRRLDETDLVRLRALDKTTVSGIEVWAHHGVFDQERRDGQLFRIDVAWWQDLTAAARQDDLALTIDYGAVAACVVELVRTEPVDLIETVVRRLQEGLLARFPMDFLQVTIHKPDAPLGLTFADVSLSSVAAPDRASRPVVFSLGSNIEPRRDHLQFAVAALASTPGIERARVSPVYESEPIGVSGHPDYLNAVLTAWSALPATALLERGLTIEALAGRRRGRPPADEAAGSAPNRTRRTPDQVPGDHPPRTLDIDLIAVGDQVSATTALILPHPRAHQRAFVLRPWLDLDPTACLSGRPVAAWSEEVRDQTIRQWPKGLFLPREGTDGAVGGDDRGQTPG